MGLNHLTTLCSIVKHQSACGGVGWGGGGVGLGWVGWTVKTHPKVVAACRQDGLVSVELLLPGDEGDVTQQAILPLLVEGREDGVLVGL